MPKERGITLFKSGYISRQQIHALVFGKLYQGFINTDQAADYLDVKTKNVAGLEQTFTRRAANK